MTARSRYMKAKQYKSVGTTTDGVRILKPKTKPKSFTTAQIRATIRKVLHERQGEQSRVEQVAKGDRERSGRPS